MSRRCIVHIGTHKTGSSSIQATLFTNRQELKDRFDIYYWDRKSNHRALLAPFIQSGTTPPKPYREPPPESEMSEKLSGEIAAHLRDNSKTTVISSEYFSVASESVVRDFSLMLRDNYDIVDIYAYVRDPFSFADSWMQQEIRAGATIAEIEVAMSESYSTTEDHYLTLMPRYRFRLEKYINIFGVDRVHVREFNRTALFNGDVVEDFCHWALGLDLKRENIPITVVNESTDIVTALVLDSLNRSDPRWIKGMQNPGRAESLMSRSAGSRPKFIYRGLDRARFANLVSEDVEWLREITGGNIAFELTPPQLPPPPDLDIFNEICRDLNREAVARAREEARARLYRYLWLIGQGRRAEAEPIRRILRAMRDADILNEAADGLGRTGLSNMALIAKEMADAAAVRKIT